MTSAELIAALSAIQKHDAELAFIDPTTLPSYFVFDVETNSIVIEVPEPPLPPEEEEGMPDKLPEEDDEEILEDDEDELELGDFKV